MAALLSIMISGFVIGVIAKLLTPGRDPGGCLVTILLGIGGSALGSYLGQVLGFYEPGQPAGWLGSVLGAVIILLIHRAVFNTRR